MYSNSKLQTQTTNKSKRLFTSAWFCHVEVPILQALPAPAHSPENHLRIIGGIFKQCNLCCFKSRIGHDHCSDQEKILVETTFEMSKKCRTQSQNIQHTSSFRVSFFNKSTDWRISFTFASALAYIAWKRGQQHNLNHSIDTTAKSIRFDNNFTVAAHVIKRPLDS
jgi:hypothetical protein